VIGLLALPAMASPLGQLRGIIQDQSGRPVPDILVTLLGQSSDRVLPILTRSNKLGRILFQNLEMGTYQVLVKSSQYVSRKEQTVRILPGKTAALTLVLQNLFDLDGSDGRNVRLKTVLRAADSRLIFRYVPGLTGPPLEKRRPGWFEEAVFQVHTNAGMGSDYLLFPGDSGGGTTANFALAESLGGNRDYVFAGQVNSGEDSLWRLKSFLDYTLSQNHSLRLFLGHGRISFQQPSLGLLGNPISLGSDVDFTTAAGTTHILSSGFEERFNWGRAVSFSWGLELNQVRTVRNHSFISPNAELSARPSERSSLRIALASKRPTYGNSVMLPDGRQIILSDSVGLSRVNDEIRFGTSRHYQGSFGYHLDVATEVELAVFRDQFFGGIVPFVAFLSYRPGAEMLRLNEDQVRTRGKRFTIRRRLGGHLRTSFSYIRGRALGFVPGDMAVVFDPSVLDGLVQEQGFDALSSQVDLFVPFSRTAITALVKIIPNGNPIPTLDALSDSYQTANQGVNVFLRQIVPVPVALLNTLGLDFLATGYEIEALLDIRNVANKDLGVVQTLLGDVELAQNPRTVRGGLTFRF
jgi:hypothetical protein